MVKINTKKLGLKKPVFVKVTVKKIKLADMMMNKLLKLGIEQDRTEISAMKILLTMQLK